METGPKSQTVDGEAQRFKGGPWAAGSVLRGLADRAWQSAAGVTEGFWQLWQRAKPGQDHSLPLRPLNAQLLISDVSA
jgi:hypothetical protein